MGLTYVEGEVGAGNGQAKTVQFLVDSGATYTLLPHAVWTSLKIQPKRKQVFRLADGTQVEREIGECHIRLPQGDGHTPVVLGQPGDDALLGVVTLEILGLVLNPFDRTLHPMRLLLA